MNDHKKRANSFVVSMDKKHLANLDPKLKEVYERVMGTNVNLAQPQQQATPPVAPPAPVQSMPIQQSAPLPMPAAPVVKPMMTTQELHTTYQPQVFTAEHHKPEQKKEEKPHATAGEKKKSGGVTPVLLGILGFVFFVAYTVFWMKLFNLTIPFLPF